MPANLELELLRPPRVIQRCHQHSAETHDDVALIGACTRCGSTLCQLCENFIVENSPCCAPCADELRTLPNRRWLSMAGLVGIIGALLFAVATGWNLVFAEATLLVVSHSLWRRQDPVPVVSAGQPSVALSGAGVLSRFEDRRRPLRSETLRFGLVALASASVLLVWLADWPIKVVLLAWWAVLAVTITALRRQGRTVGEERPRAPALQLPTRAVRTALGLSTPAERILFWPALVAWSALLHVAWFCVERLPWVYQFSSELPLRAVSLATQNVRPEPFFRAVSRGFAWATLFITPLFALAWLHG